MTTSASRKPRTVRPSKARTRSSLTPWFVGAGLLFILLIGGVIWYTNRATPAPVSKLGVPAEWVNGETLGDPAAKVTVQAWEDFLCPHCQDWTREVEPKLIADYVKSGKVRYEFHHLPLQGFEPGSSMGAQAGLCAADQNGFWPYHDLLFSTASSRGQDGFTLETLLQNAKTVGLDATEFQQCMSSQKHRPDIDASLQKASELQLNATPSLLVGDKRMGNPFDYGTMKTAIDSELAATQ